VGQHLDATPAVWGGDFEGHPYADLPAVMLHDPWETAVPLGGGPLNPGGGLLGEGDVPRTLDALGVRCSLEYPSGQDVVVPIGPSLSGLDIRAACEACEAVGLECWVRKAGNLVDPDSPWGVACLPPDTPGVVANDLTDYLCDRLSPGPFTVEACKSMTNPAQSVRRIPVCIRERGDLDPRSMRFDFPLCGNLGQRCCWGNRCDVGRADAVRGTCVCL